MSTNLVTTDPARAAHALTTGGLAAIPTETVYGLAADASQPGAVERIFEVKGRPRSHPLILHVADPDLQRWERRGWIGLDVRHRAGAIRLADAFWPGPLTMILPSGPAVVDTVTGGRTTVALRVPAHPAANAVLASIDRPVAAPSANRFGLVSPTSATHVLADIGDLLDPHRDVILDGGVSTVGLESTIVDLSSAEPQLLRYGAYTEGDIEAVLGVALAPPAGPARASGMLAAHYAPNAHVLPCEDLTEAHAAIERAERDGHRVDLLDLSIDPEGGARELYASLRAADHHGVQTLVVVLPPAVGIGIAVRDRVQRAARGSVRPGTS